jgi:hypothetical protein
VIVAFRLGLFYFAAVFATGFVLGTIRTLVLVPRLGEAGAVALELPMILAAAWFICGRLVRHRQLAAIEAVVMGAIAFALLMAAEAGLSRALGGRSLNEYLFLYAEPAHRLGLIGQMVFAVFPCLRR